MSTMRLKKLNLNVFVLAQGIPRSVRVELDICGHSKLYKKEYIPMVSRSHPYSSCDLTKAQYRGFSVETSLKSLQFLFIKLYSPCWKSHYQNKTPSIIISKSLTKFAYCFQLLQVRKTASLVCIWNDSFRGDGIHHQFDFGRRCFPVLGFLGFVSHYVS